MRHPAPGCRESGHALLLTLLALVLLAGVVALLAMLLVSRMGEVRDESRRVTLTALADGALAETLSRLAATPTYPGLPEQRMGEGVVWSRVGRPGPGALSIEVGARVGGRSFEAVATAVEQPQAAPRVVSWRPGPVEDAHGGSRGSPEG